MLGDNATQNYGSKQGSSMYDTDSIPSLPGSATNAPTEAGQKVSLTVLPPGVKQGDTVQLKVIRIDKDMGMAYLTSGETKTNSTEGTDQDQTGTGRTADSPQGGVNTNMLLGPMDKLKGYLARKSVEVQSQI
jgi:hypothetical protein